MQSRGISTTALLLSTVAATLIVEQLWNLLINRSKLFTSSTSKREEYEQDRVEDKGREVKHRYSRRHLKSMAGCAPILATEQVDEYRAAASRVVKPEDRCLEVGCHNGTTALIIAQFARAVVGVDKSIKQLSTGQAKLEIMPQCKNCELVQADAFDVKQLMELGPFDVVFIDISGSRELKTLLPLIDSYEKVLKPRLFVVKSYKLCQLYQRLRFLDKA